MHENMWDTRNARKWCTNRLPHDQRAAFSVLAVMVGRQGFQTEQGYALCCWMVDGMVRVRCPICIACVCRSVSGRQRYDMRAKMDKLSKCSRCRSIGSLHVILVFGDASRVWNLWLDFMGMPEKCARKRITEYVDSSTRKHKHTRATNTIAMIFRQHPILTSHINSAHRRCGICQAQRTSTLTSTNTIGTPKLQLQLDGVCVCICCAFAVYAIVVACACASVLAVLSGEKTNIGRGLSVGKRVHTSHKTLYDVRSNKYTYINIYIWIHRMQPNSTRVISSPPCSLY